MKQDKQNKLEIDYIDQETLHHTLKTISEICFLKADHIRSNWQDKTLSDIWDSFGRKLDTFRADIENNSKYVSGLL